MADVRSILEGQRITLRDPETGELRKAIIQDGEVLDDGPAPVGERLGRIFTMAGAEPELPEHAPPAGSMYRYEVRSGDGTARLECATLRGAQQWARIMRNDPGEYGKGAHVWDRAEQRVVGGLDIVK